MLSSSKPSGLEYSLSVTKGRGTCHLCIHFSWELKRLYLNYVMDHMTSQEINGIQRKWFVINSHKSYRIRMEWTLSFYWGQLTGFKRKCWLLMVFMAKHALQTVAPPLTEGVTELKPLSFQANSSFLTKRVKPLQRLQRPTAPTSIYLQEINSAQIQHHRIRHTSGRETLTGQVQLGRLVGLHGRVRNRSLISN